MGSDGVWGNVDATVDFCEGNYALVPWLAEAFNTISSVPIIVMGVIGLIETRRYASRERRFALAFSAIIMVGIGSTVFHATLRRGAQMLDELPMLLANFVFVFMLIERHADRKIPWLPGALWLSALALTCIYLFSDQYWIFLLAYSAQVTYIFLRSCVVARRLSREEVTPGARVALTMFMLAGLTYFTGFGLWVVDQLMCQHVQSFHLHSFWHVLAGFGTSSWIQFQLAVRGVACRKAVSMRFLPSGQNPILPQVVFGRPVKSSSN
ncbi:Alkaline ceramidase [Plasmodiophora brassicae]|uniref:Alkaline ceramidase n=1 Tax=Plasmodiophora brassicae TaxID=37360 RepID=A0A0G4IL32_PLABS|nr:hypothetical protein PBRA_004582 [Plasmodiophora brassicae]SPR00150.1 unnamed protein product [Plasmodiophora brassicae]